MVLNQLLDNGRRYTPEGSHIEVVVTGETAQGVIVVEDDGSGLDDEVLPHLFEPFYRSDTARAREGLRLTLVLMAIICGSLLGLSVLVLLLGNRRRALTPPV